MHIVCATFGKQTRLDFKWHMWQLRVPIHHRPYIILWRHIYYASIQFSSRTHWISWCQLKRFHQNVKQTHGSLNAQPIRVRKPFVCFSLFFFLPPFTLFHQQAIWLSGNFIFIFALHILTWSIRPYSDHWKLFPMRVNSSATASHFHTQTRKLSTKYYEIRNAFYIWIKIDLRLIASRKKNSKREHFFVLLASRLNLLLKF